MAIGANYTYKMQSDFWMAKAKVSLVTGQVKIGFGEYLDATLTITIIVGLGLL